jgi:hypothetical protein
VTVTSRWRVSYDIVFVDIQGRVNELVAAKTGLPIRELQPQCRLLHDLGICGDDAAELLTELATEFNIDMTGFTFNQFFPGEPHLLNFWKWPGDNDRYLPLTLQDLRQIADARRFVYHRPEAK